MKLLSKFGKFPALKKNWKPSEFNEKKVLIFIKEAKSSENRIYWSNMIVDMLYFELHLSQDLITEIMEDYKQFTDSYKIEYSNKFRFNEGLNETTIRYIYYDLLMF